MSFRSVTPGGYHLTLLEFGIYSGVPKLDPPERAQSLTFISVLTLRRRLGYHRSVGELGGEINHGQKGAGKRHHITPLLPESGSTWNDTSSLAASGQVPSAQYRIFTMRGVAYDTD
jgi:hypothetical protein